MCSFSRKRKLSLDGGATNWPVRDCRSFSWRFVGHARREDDFFFLLLILKASRVQYYYTAAWPRRNLYDQIIVWRGAKGQRGRNDGTPSPARNTVYSVGARWAGIFKRGGTGWMTGKVRLLAHSHTLGGTVLFSWTDVMLLHSHLVKVERERERDSRKCFPYAIYPTSNPIVPSASFHILLDTLPPLSCAD